VIANTATERAGDDHRECDESVAPPARLATLFLRVQLVDIGVEGVVDAVEEDVRRHEEVRRKPDSDRREQLALTSAIP